MTDDVIRQTALTHLTKSHTPPDSLPQPIRAVWRGSPRISGGSLTSPRPAHKKSPITTLSTKVVGQEIDMRTVRLLP
ncbi:hypothetical protein TUM18999_52970 [Pseudomonas tohonis]|uniref:Uncharacterized protein n=1 Tax=Pseudomonas tohonis TaxID=2725477 RepID=A0A6J4ECV4_9PSED|nr:hypothetical protein TUM18999_52970 [Pseudomonas tohonis]GJN55040.1 hypothetical protein TUM20286_47920 [Pseudomonas tohonis]